MFFFSHETPLQGTPVHVQNAFFFVLRSASVRQYLLQVPNQPSNAVYFDVATVQQQPRFKLFPVSDMNRPSACVCHQRILHQAVVGTMNTERSSISASLFLLCFLLLLCMCHPVLEALYVVTAMVQQQPHFKAFPFWEPRTVFLCVCVSACLCAILNGIWTIATYTSSDFQKHPCRTQASQSQRCNKQRTSHR